MISLRHVCKSWDGGASRAVDEVSLEVPKGQLLVLIGESGSGKTTTLKMINRLIEPTSGQIEVGGRDVRSEDPVQLRRRIGYVFQGVGLFPHLSVAQNVGIVPSLLGWAAAEIDARVLELLDLVDLPAATYGDRAPDALSGGQRQRVGVARALAARPEVVLMDEPFGALDPVTRDRLQGAYREIHSELGLTTVMVTHDMNEALSMGQRIIVMKDGKILRDAAPAELLNEPGHAYVADLMEAPRRQALLGESLVSR